MTRSAAKCATSALSQLVLSPANVRKTPAAAEDAGSKPAFAPKASFRT